MKKINSILDREPISSEHIRSKQNFNQVLKNVQTGNPGFYKSKWFYGSIGLSSVAVIVSVSLYLGSNQEKNATPTAISEKIDKVIDEPVLQDSAPLIAMAELPSREEPIISRQKESSAQKEVNSHNLPVSNATEIQKVNSNSEPEIIEVAPLETANSKIDLTTYGYSVNNLPHISNVYDGPINIDKLCSDNRIQTSSGVKVTSFKIRYEVGREEIEKSIIGDVIPPDVCAAISKYCLNGTVTFTDIRGISPRGEEYMLINFRLTPIMSPTGY